MLNCTTLHAADRNYHVRVVPRDPHHHNAQVIANEMAAEAARHGLKDQIDGLLVVTPPGRKTDPAYRLHAFNADAQPTAHNGVDALCAFQAYRQLEDHHDESLVLRLGNLPVKLTGVGKQDTTVEADLGKPSLEPTDALVDVAQMDGVQLPHTYEIEVPNYEDSVIATLVALEDMHAVIFTPSLDDLPLDRVGPAIDVHSAFPKGCTVHAAVVQEPGVVTLRSWQRGVGVTPASGLGLGAVCAAGVTNSCTLASNTARMTDGQLTAAWDDDGHLRLRGRVEAAAVATG